MGRLSRAAAPHATTANREGRRMTRMGFRIVLAATVALVAFNGPANAQKSKDTLRVAFDQPIRLIDALHNPNPEANLIDRAVMDTLIAYDVETKTYQGQLAESWT